MDEIILQYMIESKYMHIIVGLGNPGEEYKNTRHNAGRIAVTYFAKKYDFPDFEFNKKYQALASTGDVEGEKTLLLLPETFMNKSGKSLETLITSAKKAEKLIVVQDDLDMPLGKIKLLFNRGTGGHRGIESVKKVIKTEAFTRVKIGICPSTPSGKPKKPSGDKLLDFIVAPFKPTEMDEMKKISKQVAEALYMTVNEGREKAMGEFN